MSRIELRDLVKVFRAPGGTEVTSMVPVVVESCCEVLAIEELAGAALAFALALG